MRAHLTSLAVFLLGCAPMSAATSGQSPNANVLVTPQEELDRQCSLIEVLDFHAPADSEKEGFAALRRKAAALGADAVLGADFEHGDNGGPAHLSGMAVRYVDDDPRSYDILGTIDIATPEYDEDKGLVQLRDKAQAMGADMLRDIEYQADDDSGNSHLRAVAVVHRD